MKISLWNVGGIRTSVDRLLSLIRYHHVHILVVIEPRVRASSLLSYRLKLGFSQAVSVNNDNIWIFLARLLFATGWRTYRYTKPLHSVLLVTYRQLFLVHI